MQKRNILLDIIKGISILLVVLYHLDVLHYGYLGVEFFLVIVGYLTTKSLIRSNDSYWCYINKRIVRLWPLLLLICSISLSLGWMWMLPFHFKLNCESVIGTSLFVNNIVQYITSGNYWGADNGYKPLMHTWYLGIIMQFYIIYPFIFIVSKKISKDRVFCSFKIISIIFMLSIYLYSSSWLTVEQNFYFLPSRLFEFAAGSLIALYYSLKDKAKKNSALWILACCAILIGITLVSNMDIDVRKIRLILTVLLASIFVVMSEKGYRLKCQKVFKPLAICGVASFSLYLCHQVVFALYRYSFNDHFTVFSYFGILIFVLLVGFLSFYLIEKPIGKFVKGNKMRMYSVNGISLILFVIIFGVSYHYYKQNGMVRDIPELNMYLGANSETPEDYNGRAHSYNRDFEKNDKLNVLVIGDSFGRDWVNVLLESGVDSIANISYCTEPDDICINRIKKADYVFIANNTVVYEKYARIIPLAMEKNFYRVGRKSFGSWIGIVYNNDRYGKDYYAQKVPERDASIETSILEKDIIGDRFIDMMTPLKDKDGMINIFDESNKLITQDGIHITKAGAKKYAKILNVSQYFEK